MYWFCWTIERRYAWLKYLLAYEQRFWRTFLLDAEAVIPDFVIFGNFADK